MTLPDAAAVNVAGTLTAQHGPFPSGARVTTTSLPGRNPLPVTRTCAPGMIDAGTFNVAEPGDPCATAVVVGDAWLPLEHAALTQAMAATQHSEKAMRRCVPRRVTSPTEL